jgi:hypothetical protein
MRFHRHTLTIKPLRFGWFYHPAVGNTNPETGGGFRVSERRGQRVKDRPYRLYWKRPPGQEIKRGSLTSKNALESGNSQGQVNHCRINVRDPTGQPKGIFNGHVTATTAGYSFRSDRGRFPVTDTIRSLYDFHRAIFPLSSQRAKEIKFSKRFVILLQIIIHQRLASLWLTRCKGPIIASPNGLFWACCKPQQKAQKTGS